MKHVTSPRPHALAWGCVSVLETICIKVLTDGLEVGQVVSLTGVTDGLSVTAV